MYLLQPTDFVGQYKIDLNPATQTDTYNAIRQVEEEMLEYLLSDYWFYITNTPPNFLANALITNRVNTSSGIVIKHVTYSYAQYAVEHVYNKLKGRVVQRGEVKEDELYTRNTFFNMKLMRVKKDFCDMFSFLKQKVFVTNASGDLVIDLSNEDFHYKPRHAILPFAIGINLLDIQNNTIHTITAEALSVSTYTYSFTPAALPNARMRLLLRLYDCRKNDIILV